MTCRPASRSFHFQTVHFRMQRNTSIVPATFDILVIRQVSQGDDHRFPPSLAAVCTYIACAPLWLEPTRYGENDPPTDVSNEWDGLKCLACSGSREDFRRRSTSPLHAGHAHSSFRPLDRWMTGSFCFVNGTWFIVRVGGLGAKKPGRVDSPIV